MWDDMETVFITLKLKLKTGNSKEKSPRNSQVTRTNSLVIWVNAEMPNNSDDSYREY